MYNSTVILFYRNQTRYNLQAPGDCVYVYVYACICVYVYVYDYVYVYVFSHSMSVCLSLSHRRTVWKGKRMRPKIHWSERTELPFSFLVGVEWLLHHLDEISSGDVISSEMMPHPRPPAAIISTSRARAL